MKLIDEWKSAHKMISMWCMAGSGAFLTTWSNLPPEFQALIPHGYMVTASVVLLVLGMIGRVVKQDGVSGNAESKQ